MERVRRDVREAALPICNATGGGRMITAFVRWSLIAISCIPAALTYTQEARAQGACNPAVDRTQGNVTVTFSGGCTVGITPVELKEIIDSIQARRPIPPELLDRYEKASRTLGVTETALETFFRILGENKVAPEDIDAKLREIAGRHLTLLRQAEVSSDDDPQIATLKKDAVAAIEAGDYGRAEDLLRRASDADDAALRRVEDAARRPRLSSTHAPWPQRRHGPTGQR